MSKEDTSNIGRVQFAVWRILDTVWTIGYIEDKPGYVRILINERDNPIGYASEDALLKGKLIETEDRIVTHLTLYPLDYRFPLNHEPVKTLEVINKQYVFSY